MPNIKDFATALIVTAPSPATSGTTLVVETGKAARFPTPPFYATIHPEHVLPTLDNAEKVQVTAVNTSTDTLTIVRAQSPTTAQTITGSSTYRISNAIFAGDLYNSTQIKNEVPTGAINGTNTAFTTSQAYTAGSLRVHQNGLRLQAGSGNDYVETAGGFTMNTSPATGDVILCDYDIGNTSYIQGTNSLITDEAVVETPDGSRTTFTCQRPYNANSLEVYINGLHQTRGTHVTETSPSAGTFTLDTAPITGQVIRVNYQYSANSSGNADTVDGIHASSTPVANALLALTANSRFRGTAMVNVLLDNVETADLFSALNVPGTTWTDLRANQNFTVSSSNSIIVIMVECGMQAGTTAQTAFGARVVIDSGGTPIYRNCGATAVFANGYGNPFSGNAPIILTGLSAGVHTIKTQMYAAAAVLAYCRPSSSPYEGYRTTIIEIGG